MVISETRGLIANVNATTNELKVKLNNLQQEFSSSEAIISNSTVSSVSAGGDGLLTTTPFKSNVVAQEVTTANSNATAIAPSPFIAEKMLFLKILSCVYMKFTTQENGILLIKQVIQQEKVKAELGLTIFQLSLQR